MFTDVRHICVGMKCIQYTKKKGRLYWSICIQSTSNIPIISPSIYLKEARQIYMDIYIYVYDSLTEKNLTGLTVDYSYYILLIKYLPISIELLFYLLHVNY